MSSERFLYFAYGSNMLKQRMLCYNPCAMKVLKGPAILEDYRLVFCRDYPLPGPWHGPHATLRKFPGSHVWGVIWELEDSIIDELDKQEKTHQSFDIEVKDLKDNTFTCRTYAMKEDQGQVELPSPHYKDVIVRGAKQSGLPESYVNFLKGLKDNGYGGRIQLYQDIIQILNQQA